MRAIATSGFAADVVVVDDGSTDGSGEVVRAAIADRVPLTVVVQPNRDASRRAARGSTRPPASGFSCSTAAAAFCRRAWFVGERIGPDARIWNGHVYVDRGVTRTAHSGTFSPRSPGANTSTIPDDELRQRKLRPLPQGHRLLPGPERPSARGDRASPGARTRTCASSATTRGSSAGSPRASAFISLRLLALHAPRSDLHAFLRQALYRGSTFVDGHAKRESRFFPVAIAFFPVSAALAVLTARRPAGVFPVLALGSGIAAGSVAKAARRPRFEVVSCAVLVPVYAVAHGLGMWRGLAMILAARMSDRRRGPG